MPLKNDQKWPFLTLFDIFDPLQKSDQKVIKKSDQKKWVKNKLIFWTHFFDVKIDVKIDIKMDIKIDFKSDLQKLM